MRLPVLIQHGGQDLLVPPAANRALYDAIGSADKTVRIYDGLYHEIYNEPEREAVLDDLVAWLKAHPRGLTVSPRVRCRGPDYPLQCRPVRAFVRSARRRKSPGAPRYPVPAR